ncbi:transposase [Carbonactinospora thermoautotrophica]|uniref:transposase n=1 Tax=Carbonactinospora thermoautotrophica TaxID=1469144 RepID=UPI0013010C27|nr:transposase [Carbonactinospora thermoautotrophica]
MDRRGAGHQPPCRPRPRHRVPPRPQRRRHGLSLITAILGPQAAPAAELAALYHQRWEIESTLDEIKTHLGGPRLVLRSRHPAGAEQEIFAFLLAHHAPRDLTHHAARHADQDPDRVSFTRTLRVARRHLPGRAAFPPSPGCAPQSCVRSGSASRRRGGRAPIPAWSTARCPTGR